MTQLMREAVEALRQFIEEKVNYMRINHLGDPEKTHTVKYGRIALSHLTEELRRQEGRALTDEELADCGLLSGLVEGVKVEPWVRPQECSATGASHHDGPYGPMRQTQCYYCGQPPTAAAQALHTDQAAEGGENACEAPRPKLADLRGLLRSDQVLPRDDTSVEADRGGEHGVQDEAQALDLLDKLFTAYLDSVDVPEDQKEQAGHLGHAMKLDDETFYACANLLNRTRPQDRGGER